MIDWRVTGPAKVTGSLLWFRNGEASRTFVEKTLSRLERKQTNIRNEIESKTWTTREKRRGILIGSTVTIGPSRPLLARGRLKDGRKEEGEEEETRRKGASCGAWFNEKTDR